jgi:hypothetical protein
MRIVVGRAVGQVYVLDVASQIKGILGRVALDQLVVEGVDEVAQAVIVASAVVTERIADGLRDLQPRAEALVVNIAPHACLPIQVEVEDAWQRDAEALPGVHRADLVDLGLVLFADLAEVLLEGLLSVLDCARLLVRVAQAQLELEAHALESIGAARRMKADEVKDHFRAEVLDLEEAREVVRAVLEAGQRIAGQLQAVFVPLDQSLAQQRLHDGVGFLLGEAEELLDLHRAQIAANVGDPQRKFSDHGQSFLVADCAGNREALRGHGEGDLIERKTLAQLFLFGRDHAGTPWIAAACSVAKDTPSRCSSM